MEWFEDIFNRQIFFDLYEEEDSRLAASEADGVVRLLELSGGESILDVCCGYGRHSTELAKRGFRVVGLDISEVQLRRAQEKSRRAALEIEFVRADIRDFALPQRFDCAINMFLSLGYFRTDGEHVRAVRNVAAALKPGGRFLIDQWNREKVIADLKETEREQVGGVTITKSWSFDHLAGRIEWTNRVAFPDGRVESWDHSIRAFTVVEWKKLLEAGGFVLENVYGGWNGEPFTLRSPNAIMVAKRIQ